MMLGCSTSKLKIENYSSFVLRKSLTNEYLHSSENLAHFSHLSNMCASDVGVWRVNKNREI